tara:strand:- start:99 stop:329 length:231 start_codon:yes stop_codon:yes gene_type:complete
MKTFLLVISIWGFTAEEEWVYVGNNVVLDVLMSKEQCDAMAENWVWREKNEYYKLLTSCELAKLPADPKKPKGKMS